MTQTQDPDTQDFENPQPREPLAHPTQKLRPPNARHFTAQAEEPTPEKN